MLSKRERERWWVYHLTPIDFGWELLPSVVEMAARIASHEIGTYTDTIADEFESDEVKSASVQFSRDLKVAFELAREKEWEGDFRAGCEPHVLLLPDEMEIKYAFVWKQDNNGTTFVVSPIELPWLYEGE